MVVPVLCHVNELFDSLGLSAVAHSKNFCRASTFEEIVLMSINCVAALDSGVLDWTEY